MSMSMSWPATRTMPFQIWLAPALIACVGLAVQSATVLNHDVAWVLYGAGRMLDGAVFGTDIVAANPPLVWWVSVVPAAAARLFGLPPEIALRMFVALLAAISLVSCERLLRPGLSPLLRSGFLALCAYFLFVGVHRDFGQREHIALILALPYMFAAARRMRGDTLPVAAALAIGIAAGIGFAFKPHLLAVPMAIEALVLWRRRSLALPFRPENLAIAAVVIVYVGAVFLFAGPYLRDVIPAVSKIYWAFNYPVWGIVVGNGLILCLIAMTALLMRFSAFNAESAVLAAAALGFFIAAAAQSKGYTYHFFPAFACAVLALAALTPSAGRFRIVAGAIVAAALASSVLNASDRLSYRYTSGTFGLEQAQMVALVRENVPGDGSFLALSTHPYPGFPTAIYAERRWAARTNSRLFLPAIVRLREGATQPAPGILEMAEASEHQAILADMAARPDLVLVASGGTRHAIRDSAFDFLAFYREDPAFEALWANYREIDGAPVGYRAFVKRQEAGS